jgi:hypothetical protein
MVIDGTPLFNEEKDEDDEEEEEEKPEIHTNLTTSNALKLFRTVNQHWVSIYVKTVPCGQIVKMQVEKEWTVQDLYVQAGILPEAQPEPS